MSLEERVTDYKWRVIPHSVASAPWQMAVDHALLEVMHQRLVRGEEVQPTIRTYQFDKKSIILGHRQNGDKFDSTALEDGYFTTRVSGGGHMYFSPVDVNYTAVLPKKLMPKDMVEGYRMINYPVVNALKSFGYNARLGRMSIKIDLEKEKTLVGTAQRRLGPALLQHGCILIDDYTPQIFQLLNASSDEIEVWKEQVVTLSMLNGNINSGQLVSSILKSFAGEDYVNSELDNSELEIAKQAHDEIYNNPEIVGKGSKQRENICLLDGLMTKNYEQHLKENSVES